MAVEYTSPNDLLNFIVGVSSWKERLLPSELKDLASTVLGMDSYTFRANLQELWTTDKIIVTPNLTITIPSSKK